MFSFQKTLFKTLASNQNLRFRFYSTIRAFTDNEFAFVESGDGPKKEQLKYPLIWLRDNCQCSECFHPDATSRLIDWENFSMENAKLKAVEVNNGVKFTWKDGHVSNFNLDWLKERNFSKETQESYLKTQYRLPMHLWSKDEFKNVYREYKFNDVIESDDALREWIEALSKYGYALLTGTPAREDQCKLLAERIGFIRQTHYGVQYAIRVKEGTNNIAYLNKPLQMHNDIPFYDYVPGVTVLHCLEQTKSPGAFNLLTDAFYASERLRSEHPEYFKILSTTMVNWSDYGAEDGYTFRTINRAPVIW